MFYIQKLFPFTFFRSNNELRMREDSIYIINYFHQFGQEVGYLELAEEIGSL